MPLFQIQSWHPAYRATESNNVESTAPYSIGLFRWTSNYKNELRAASARSLIELHPAKILCFLPSKACHARIRAQENFDKSMRIDVAVFDDNKLSGSYGCRKGNV
jgi:hypothetical protein